MMKNSQRLAIGCGLMLFALGCEERPAPPRTAAPSNAVAPANAAKKSETTNPQEQGPMHLRNTKEELLADNADLRGSSFRNANLSAATFDDVNLAKAKLNNVNLSGVEIADANIEGMMIDGVSVADALAAYRKGK